MTFAVIFSSKRTKLHSELYYQHNDLLEEKIANLPGYIRHYGVRHPETREGITIVYFEALEAIKEWRDDLDHQSAKSLAKTHFYENYSIDIVEVERSYQWEKSEH